jgi:putative polyhydroxyalkanoate system protein
MASFTVRKPHTMEKQELREAVDRLAAELQSRHGLSYRWRGDNATFSRSGISGSLSIDSDEIALHVKLGLMASPFERPIRQAITDFLDENVA